MKALTPPRLFAVSLALVVSVASCKKNTQAQSDPTWWSLEAERVELAGKVKVLELKLSKVEGRGENYTEVKAERDETFMRRDTLEERVVSLRSEVSELAENFSADRKTWIQMARNESIGRTFETFSGLRGKTYRDVEVTAVTDIGVEFKHASGRARLAAAELTFSQQAEFGLDLDDASDALRNEKAVAKAYHNWVDKRVAVVEARAEEREQEKIALASAAARAAARRKVSSSAVTMNDSGRNRLRNRPRSFGRRDSNYSVWYPSYSYGRRSYYSASGCYSRSPVQSNSSRYSPRNFDAGSLKPRSSSFYIAP